MDGRILPLLYTGTKTSRLTGLAFSSVGHSNKYKNEIYPRSSLCYGSRICHRLHASVVRFIVSMGIETVVLICRPHTSYE